MLDDAGDAEDDYVEDIAGGTAGFYDDVTGRLVVRGDRFGAYEEMVLVHELTHALQDQWFQLDRPELQDGGEAGGAFGALIEGDAMRVMLAWEEAQPPDVRDELAPDVEDDELDGADEGFDPYLAEGEYLYGAGLELVLELLERGGQELLDETFRNPPGSSQQVRTRSWSASRSRSVRRRRAPQARCSTRASSGRSGWLTCSRPTRRSRALRRAGRATAT